jgi:hypothetical protein
MRYRFKKETVEPFSMSYGVNKTKVEPFRLRSWQRVVSESEVNGRTVRLIETVEVEVEALPRVSFAERRHLPSVPGIYFALAAEGQALYIGQAVDIRERWVGHARLRQLRDLRCASIAWRVEEDHEDRLWLEWDCINKLKPVLNGTTIPGQGKDRRPKYKLVRVHPNWNRYRYVPV